MSGGCMCGFVRHCPIHGDEYADIEPPDPESSQMAYLKSIEQNCPCGKRATVEVFGSKNQSFGAFCSTCGERKKRYIESMESRDRASDSLSDRMKRANRKP